VRTSPHRPLRDHRKRGPIRARGDPKRVPLLTLAMGCAFWSDLCVFDECRTAAVLELPHHRAREHQVTDSASGRTAGASDPTDDPLVVARREAATAICAGKPRSVVSPSQMPDARLRRSGIDARYSPRLQRIDASGESFRTMLSAARLSGKMSATNVS
jgi:hypothetical protein